MAEGTAALENAAAEGKKHFTALLKAANERLAYAKEQLARWEKEAKALEHAKNDPSKPENNTWVSMDLLRQMYAAMARMQEIEVAAHTHNLELVNSGAPMSGGAFHVPNSSFEYLDQRRKMDLASSRYFVRYHLRGVDAVLRATENGQAINASTPAQIAEREAATAELKAAAEASQAFAKFLTQLGMDLRAVREINRWGIDTQEKWDKLDTVSREGYMLHPNWQRLEGLMPLLRELKERVGPYPALDKMFEAWKHEKLPFSDAPIVSSMAPPPDPTPVKSGADQLDTMAGKAGRPSSFKLP